MTCSVVLATYNAKEYIHELLTSLANQTRPAEEVIISDDASTDGTVEIVKEFISANSLDNWKIFINTENLGWKANFRKALEYCEGDFIFLCDQDDIWKKEKIESMLSEIKKDESIELLASDYEPFGSGYNKLFFKVEGRHKEDGSVTKTEFDETHLDVMRPGCTYCIRKNLYEEMKRNDLPGEAHDAVLWRLAIVRGTLYALSRKLVEYRRHYNNATTLGFSYSVKNRIDQIEELKKSCSFMRRYAQENDIPLMQEKLSEYESFLTGRKNLISGGNVPGVLKLALTCGSEYTTARNRISDVMAALYMLTARRK